MDLKYACPGGAFVPKVRDYYGSRLSPLFKKAYTNATEEWIHYLKTAIQADEDVNKSLFAKGNLYLVSRKTDGSSMADVLEKHGTKRCGALLNKISADLWDDLSFYLR